MNGRIKMQKKFEKKFKNDDEKREYYRNKAQEYRRNVLDRDIENNYFSYRKDTQGPVNTDDTPFIPPMPDKKSQDAYFRKLVNIDRNRHLKEPGWSYEETVTHDLSDEYGWDWTPGHAGYRTDVFASKNCVFDLGKFCGVNKKPEDLEVNECTMPFQSGKFSGVSICRDKNGYFVTTHRSRSKSYESIDKIPISVIKKVEKTGNLKKEVIMDWEILKEASRISRELDRILAVKKKPHERGMNIKDVENIFLVLNKKGQSLGKLLAKIREMQERIRAARDVISEKTKEIMDLIQELGIELPEVKDMDVDEYLELFEEGNGKIGELDSVVLASIENLDTIFKISTRVKASVNANELLMEIPDVLARIREIIDDDRVFERVEQVFNEEIYKLFKFTMYYYKTFRAMNSKMSKFVNEQIKERGVTDIGKDVVKLSSYEKKAFLGKVWETIKSWFKKIKDAAVEWISSIVAVQDDVEETNELLEELRDNLEIVEEVANEG